MKKRQYKIVRLHYSNGEIRYTIQRKCRFFGLDLWKFYQDVYDGNYCSHASWTFWWRPCTTFPTELDAKNELTAIILRNGKNTIVNIETMSSHLG